MNIKFKRVFVLMIVFMIIFNSIPMQVDAHRAYFLQALIDEGQLLYVGNVVKDSSLTEVGKLEAQHWNYDGSQLPSNPDSYSSLEGEPEARDLLFSFPSKAIKGFANIKANNNAGARDEGRAFEIVDTLIPNLNELLIIANGGQRFSTIDDLVNESVRMAQAVKSNGSVTAPNGSMINFSNGKAIVSRPGNLDNTEYIISMNKGYTTSNYEDGKPSRLYEGLEYDTATDKIDIADIITQANYTYVVKGHSALDSQEYADPGIVERKVTEFLSSLISSLRSALGLREIEALVFNEGVIGSSNYYNGMMPTTWYQKSMAFHMIFQAMTWIAIGIAIIKLAWQRNLATISASSRISLMDGIKDLMIAGFMLMGVFLAINLMGTLNKAIVNIFSNTVDFSDSGTVAMVTGSNLVINTIGGVIMQLYYLLITLYLNVIYVARAISLSILIAIAPIFIGTIAFQTKGKDYFETWLRMLVADIFVQSFHGFILSFFLSIQMSTTRGIELAVVSFALIPATKMFKELITKSSGGLMSGAGNGLAMVGAAAGGMIGRASKGGGSSGASNYKGSVDESSGGGTPSKKQTKNALNNRRVEVGSNSEKEVGKNMSSIQNARDKLISKTSEGVSTVKQGAKDVYDKMPEKVQKGMSTVGEKGVNVAKSTAKAAPGLAKDVGKGALKVGAGAIVGMAYGGLNSSAASSAGRMMGSGIGQAAGGVGTAAGAIKSGFSQKEGLRGAEELSNGNIALHKDRDYLKSKGLDSARMTEQEDLEMVYELDNLPEKDLENINAIREKSGDSEYLNKRGISGVYDTANGNVAVHYNRDGMNKLGLNSAYTTNDKIVETKKPGQPIDTKLSYSIADTKPKETTDPSGKPSAGQNAPRTIDYGPSYGGESIEGGQSNVELDDLM